MSKNVIDMLEVKKKRLIDLKELRSHLQKVMDAVESKFEKDPEYLAWFVRKYEEIEEKLSAYSKVKASKGGTHA